jgi:hypothetical protein
MVRVPAAVRRALAGWHRCECTLAVAAIGVMAGVLVVDLVGREAIGPVARALGLPAGAIAIQGAPKVAVIALAVATYAGLGVASARGTHLVPRIAFGVLPARWRATVDRIADALTAAVLLAVAAAGALLVHGSFVLGTRMATLDTPVWIAQLALPAGFASAALRHAAFAAWPALRPPRAGDAA